MRYHPHHQLVPAVLDAVQESLPFLHRPMPYRVAKRLVSPPVFHIWRCGPLWGPILTCMSLFSCHSLHIPSRM